MPVSCSNNYYSGRAYNWTPCGYYWSINNTNLILHRQRHLLSASEYYTCRSIPSSIPFYYILVDEELNYDHLAMGLKKALEHDKTVFDAGRLQKYTGAELQELLKWPRPLPLEDERVRLLHEVGRELEKNFDGKAFNLVESCNKSAAKLVALVTRHFPGFRDHSMYKGHQVFLYKRAQIFTADLWGAFNGKGYGEFNDIGSITMFADYIVPAVLQDFGVLKYSPSLGSIIESNHEIGPGSEEEVELRACTIYAVEQMRDMIHLKTGKQVLSVELDLWLWSYGVKAPSLQHHRTLSIYY